MTQFLSLIKDENKKVNLDLVEEDDFFSIKKEKKTYKRYPLRSSL